MTARFDAFRQTAFSLVAAFAAPARAAAPPTVHPLTAEDVSAYFDWMLPAEMTRADIAGASWRDNGAIILVPKLADAAPIVDRIAAERPREIRV